MCHELQHCMLQAETWRSQELSKVLIELVGEDLIKEWQMHFRARRSQVTPCGISNSPK